MRLTLVGDSIVGDAADGEGGLAKALAPHFDLNAVGVAGSTVANWLHASGYEGPGRGYVMGRWGERSWLKPLSHEQRHRAFLPSLAEDSDCGWWINLGTNDRLCGRSPKMWVEQAMVLLEVVPAQRVVWTIGNNIRSHAHWRQSALTTLQSTANEKWPGRVLVLDGRDRAYRRGLVHPRGSSHERWVNTHLERVEAHLTEVDRRVAIQKALRILAAIFWAIGGFQ